METWELLKMLKQNKNLKIIDMETGDRCWLDEQGFLVSEGSKYYMTADGEWKLAHDPVRFEEAFLAYKNGHGIKCVLDGKAFHYGEYSSDILIPIKHIAEGIWYILN